MTIRHKNKSLIIKKRTGKRNFVFGVFKVSEKIMSMACIAGLLVTMNLPLLSAYEAHVINVTAQICKDMGRTATIGYWKNHPEDYMPHLPMSLGSELITNESEANFILNYGDDASDMTNKLKGQLLAMKFGVVHFGVGDYFLEREGDILAGILQDLEDAGKDTQGILDYFGTDDGKTFYEIVVDAEDMLTADPVPNDEELDAMKDLLNGINDLHEIRYCALPPPEIILNEFLPNPYDDDKAEMPDGEWVELFNNSDIDIDVGGWYLYDSYDEHPLEITLENSDNNSDPTDIGETVVPSYGWLVVYVNEAYDDWLNNTGEDMIRLYDGPIETGNLISYYNYNGADFDSLTPTPAEINIDDSAGVGGSSIPENKSFARIPDGIGAWVDPDPTPGAPNILEDHSIVSSDSAFDVVDIIDADDSDNAIDVDDNADDSDGGTGEDLNSDADDEVRGEDLEDVANSEGELDAIDDEDLLPANDAVNSEGDEMGGINDNAGDNIGNDTDDIADDTNGSTQENESIDEDNNNVDSISDDTSGSMQENEVDSDDVSGIADSAGDSGADSNEGEGVGVDVDEDVKSDAGEAGFYDDPDTEDIGGDSESNSEDLLAEGLSPEIPSPEESLTEELLIEEFSPEESLTEELPVEESLTEELLTKELPVEESLIEELPVEESSPEESLTEELLIEELPVEESAE